MKKKKKKRKKRKKKKTKTMQPLQEPQDEPHQKFVECFLLVHVHDMLDI